MKYYFYKEWYSLPHGDLTSYMDQYPSTLYYNEAEYDECFDTVSESSKI